MYYLIFCKMRGLSPEALQRKGFEKFYGILNGVIVKKIKIALDIGGKFVQNDIDISENRREIL